MDRALHIFSWVCLYFLFFVSLLAFGGVTYPLFYIGQALIVFAFLANIPLIYYERNYLDDYPHFLRLPLLCVVAFLVIIQIQFVFGLKILEGSVIGTINRQMTFDSLLYVYHVMILYLLCMKLFAQRDPLIRFVTWFTFFVIVMTVLAVIQRLAAPHFKILWNAFLSESNKGLNTFGPFVNENHFGGFMGLALPLILGTLAYRAIQVTDPLKGGGQKFSFNQLKEYLHTGVIFYFSMAAFIVVATIYSQTRFAAVVLTLGLFIVSIIILIKKFSWKTLIMFIVFYGFLGLVVMNMGASRIFENYLNIKFENSTMAGRLDVYGDTINLIKDYPLFGTGLGTFYYISAKYITHTEQHIHWDHVHNEYLELMAETGLIGFALMMVAFVWVVFSAAKYIHLNPSRFNRVISLQALLAVGLLSVMCLTDFHLKIPVIAYLFVVQLALLSKLSQKYITTNSLLGPKKSLPLKFFPKNLFLVCSLIICGILLFADYQGIKRYQYTFRRQISQFNVRKAIEFAPSDDRLWFKLAQSIVRDIQDAGLFEGTLLRQKAIQALRQTVILSPTFGHYWYSLGVLQYNFGEMEQALAALRKAVEWAPHKDEYRKTLLEAEEKYANR